MRTPRTHILSSHPRNAEGEDEENPKIIFDSDIRQLEEDEDVSPASPLRLKLKKLPQVQVDMIHSRVAGTANTTKVGSSITADNPFDGIVVVNRNRKATDNSSSLELQQNIQTTMRIVGGNHNMGQQAN
jgi:hypothetical protein